MGLGIDKEKTQFQYTEPQSVFDRSTSFFFWENRYLVGNVGQILYTNMSRGSFIYKFVCVRGEYSYILNIQISNPQLLIFRGLVHRKTSIEISWLAPN